jgi:serine protease
VGVGNAVLKPVPAGMTPEQYVAKLSKQPGVLAAEPDYLLEPATTYTSTPNDPDFSTTATFGFGSVNVPSAKSWPLRGTYSSHFDQVWPALASADATPGQVHVAVLDTGFYFDHPDARFSNIRGVKDECATYNPNNGVLTTDFDVTPVPTIDEGGTEVVAVTSHGTMTAGEVGAAANNLEGSLGATYDTVVDVYKVMGTASEAGQGFDKGDSLIPESAIINGINDAVAASQREGYRLVINISLVLTDPDAQTLSLLKAAVASARSKGVLVVCAAGNEGSTPVLYPAACAGAVAVGATTISTSGVIRGSYSNYGSALDIMASGTNVWGPMKPGQIAGAGDVPNYTWWSGTSMASPLVASAAALLLRVEPTLTATEVVTYLQNGARNLGATGRDDLTGWGYLDAYRSYYLMAAPRTTADVKPLYPLQATIHFTVEDRDSGPDVTTFYSFDGGPTLSDQSATLSWVGVHLIQYWSVDSNGVAEAPTTKTFEIVLDATPPVTTSDAVSTYAGKATIHLSATDEGPESRGLGSTFYSLDGAATRTGTTVTTGKAGKHTLTYWSEDVVGNVEAHRVATFTVQPLPTVATLSRSASAIRRGSRVRFSGSLTPGRIGDYVRIQVKTPGSRTWRYIGGGDYRIYRRTVTSVSSTNKGTWSPVTIPLRSRGTYYFRAVFSGDSTVWARMSDMSPTVSVAVR